jgi:hypothetical protein
VLVPEGSQERGELKGVIIRYMMCYEQSPPYLPLLRGGRITSGHHKRLMQQICIFLPLGKGELRGIDYYIYDVSLFNSPLL